VKQAVRQQKKCDSSIKVRTGNGFGVLFAAVNLIQSGGHNLWMPHIKKALRISQWNCHGAVMSALSMICGTNGVLDLPVLSLK
jgi:hypothetical protein